MIEENTELKSVLKNFHEEKRISNNLNQYLHPDLSIIIPAYNEEKTIANIISIVKKVVSSHGLLYEIIIINDGSKDNTRELAEKSGEKVINLTKNVGKACALKTGFSASTGLNILTVDADGSHQKEDISNLIAIYLKRNIHMLIGSRFMNKPKNRFTTCTNIVGNKLFKYLLLFISGRYITDSQSGLRIFSKKIIDSINLTSKGYEIESELTTKAIVNGFTIEEIPIICKPRIYGTSHLNSIIDGMKIVKTIILSYLYGRNQYKKYETINSILKSNIASSYSESLR